MGVKSKCICIQYAIRIPFVTCCKDCELLSRCFVALAIILSMRAYMQSDQSIGVDCACVNFSTWRGALRCVQSLTALWLITFDMCFAKPSKYPLGDWATRGGGVLELQSTIRADPGGGGAGGVFLRFDPRSMVRSTVQSITTVKV